MEKRWLLRLGPPAAALVGLGLLASVPAGAIEEDWVPPECDDGAGRIARAATVAPPNAPARLAGETWYRLDPVLDDGGTLAGQRLEIGRHGAPSRRLALPPESFAAGPFGRLVLVGADDGRLSTLRAIDASAGCAGLVARESSVIRRATIDPGGTTVYEFRVDRLTRADLGVWRRPLAGGRAERVLGPLARDAQFGRTFSTELGWSLEGDQLVVHQCGQASCRVRLVETGSGRVATVASPEIGEIVGVARGRLVAYAACRGLPCPLLAVEVATGRQVILAAAAGLARLAWSAAGPRIVYEIGSDRARHIRSINLLGGEAVTVGAPADDLRVVPAGHRASSGMRTPDGWLLLAPGGRAGGDGRAVLLRVADGFAIPLAEAIR